MRHGDEPQGDARGTVHAQHPRPRMEQDVRPSRPVALHVLTNRLFLIRPVLALYTRRRLS